MIEVTAKLIYLQSRIDSLRWARDKPGTPERDEYEMLRSICADIRAQLAEPAHIAHRALSHQVQAARRQKARAGFMPIKSQQAIADALLAHWPAVQHALREQARVEEWKEAGHG